MVETRWNKLFLLLMLVIELTVVSSGARIRQLSLSSTVREGEEATLSCENVMDVHHNCDSSTWLFSHYNKETVELVKLGQIKKKTNIDRLSVTANCSLLIKKVTVEDVGRYTCRQFDKSGTHQDPDAVVDLSVVVMTEHKRSDDITFHCSVRTNEQCKRTVRWLFKGRDVDKDNPQIKTSQSPCSATVNFLTYDLEPLSQFFQCSVSAETNKEPLTFSLRPSGEVPKSTTTTANTLKVDTTVTASATDDNTTKDLWWVYIIVAAAAVALLIIAVKVVRWRRSEGKNTQGNDNVALTSKPTVAQSVPQTSQDMADPEDGVSYASVSYTKTANSQAKIRGKSDDDINTVTYSTVKASSTDPSALYATICN